MLDFRPTQIHNRNYHNNAKHAITTNYVFVSDEKFLRYVTNSLFQVRFVFALLVVKCDVTCSGNKQCRNSGEK